MEFIRTRRLPICLSLLVVMIGLLLVWRPASGKMFEERRFFVSAFPGQIIRVANVSEPQDGLVRTSFRVIGLSAQEGKRSFYLDLDAFGQVAGCYGCRVKEGIIFGGIYEADFDSKTEEYYIYRISK